jgi:L-ascorbate metabolism protein UlaG (beta-lactamase superfamily)
MKIFLILFIFVAISCASNVVGTKNNIERKINPNLPVVKKGWQGNIVLDGRFSYDTVADYKSLSAGFKLGFSRNPQKEEKRNDIFQLQIQHFNPVSMQENSIVWLGQSSFLININGIRLITDPSFFNMGFIKRKAALPCHIDSLKPINYLLVSHDHRDHFGTKSVESLVSSNPDMEALIPLGGSRLFSGKILGNVKMQEAGWYQEYKLADDIWIVFLPAKHGGRRGLTDANKVLWGSFLIISDTLKIFFAGDTAYDKQIFKEVQNLFGDIDICMLPIGSYSPQWFMSDIHTTPEEAVQIFLDLGGKWLIPMHYGTFDQSDEPLGEPLIRLLNCGINDQIKILAVGEEFLFFH